MTDPDDDGGRVPCGMAIGRALAEGGVTHVFALTGGHVVPILDGCHAAGIRVIAFRDERSAAFAAAAYGALTRRTGVCVVTAGPGLTNAVTGLAQAEHGDWPVLSIAGAAEASLSGLGALQELDQDALLRPISKSSATVRVAEQAADAVERALRTALAAPRGHVHLSFPVDVLAQEVNQRRRGALAASPDDSSDAHADVTGRPSAVEDGLLRLIDSARRPLLLIGPGAWQHGADAEVRAFVEASGIPAFTHEESRGLLPDSHPLCLGSVIFRLNARTRLLQQADLIIGVGADADWRLTFLEPPLVAQDANVVLLTRDPAARRPRTLRSAVIACEERGLLQRLTRSLRPPDGPPWTAGMPMQAPPPQVDGDGDGIHPARIARAVERARDAHDANVVIDGGNIGKWAKQQVRAERAGQANRLKGRFGAIGHGLPSAMVRRLTDPGRACILLTGDGSFGYGTLELETAVREDLPIVVVVAVDGAWGSVQSGLASRLSARRQMTYTELPHTRFDLLAQALGARGIWVEEEGALDAALDDAIRGGGTCVVAVHTCTVPSPATYPTQGY